MKKYLYLAFAAMLLGLTACSSDEPVGPDPGPDPNPVFSEEERNFGADNYSDVVVTGGRQDFYYLDEDGMIAVDIAGYLNYLTDEARNAIRMTPIVGVEVSTDSSFPGGNTRQYLTQNLTDGRKIVVSVTGLRENTTYYFRTTYLGGGAFGSTRSFTTGSVSDVASKMKVATADATAVTENAATVVLGEKSSGVAYAKNQSLLTADKVKDAINHADNGVQLSKSGKLADLTGGTVYFYCEYRHIKDYVILGEVKSFTTGGYNPAKLAEHMTITASLNETTQMWTANIQSSLSSQSDMQGKNIKYGIKPMMRTSYTDGDYDKYGVEWRFGSSDAYEAYATQNGNTYQASIENPYYNGTFGIDEYGNDHWLEDWYNKMWQEDADFWQDMHMFDFLKEKIQRGIASEKEMIIYDELLGNVGYVFNRNAPRYASYAKNYLQVFVEIDRVRYVVKEQEGKLRVPTLEDHSLYSSTTGRRTNKMGFGQNR